MLSTRLRSEAMEILHLNQIHQLRAWRQLKSQIAALPASTPPETLAEANAQQETALLSLLASINAIASAMQHTG